MNRKKLKKYFDEAYDDVTTTQNMVAGLREKIESLEEKVKNIEWGIGHPAKFKIGDKIAFKLASMRKPISVIIVGIEVFGTGPFRNYEVVDIITGEKRSVGERELFDFQEELTIKSK